MAKLSRRALFPLAAVGAVAVGGSAASAPTIDDYGLLNVRLRRVHWSKEWEVVVPDFDAMRHWHPGIPMPVKLMPLSEYLAMLDETLDG